VLPAVAVFGLAVLIILRLTDPSDGDMTGFSRSTRTGSPSVESASAILCNGPEADADTSTSMVKVAEALDASELARLHLTTPLLSVIVAGRLQLELR
jgi:hypothetical protein